MEELKKQYNYYLKRYKDGCNYMMEHQDEWNKYEPVVMMFLHKMNILLADIKVFTNDEALEGFKIE